MLSLFFGDIMNAKMTITVPINQIPKEVDKLLYSLSIKLDSLIKEAELVLSNDTIENKIIVIDQIRKKLALLDLNYEDCQSILSGYLKYEAEKNDSASNQNTQISDNNG